MADAVGRAVEHYRRHLKLEGRLKESEREMARRVLGLSADEMAEYVRLTTELDDAAAEADAYAEARDLQDGTRRTYLNTALNSAGRN